MPPLPPDTFAQPVLPSADCCHWIVPVEPLTVIDVLVPLQTVANAAAAVPPTLNPFTVTNAEVLDAEVQTPLVTKAL